MTSNDPFQSLPEFKKPKLTDEQKQQIVVGVIACVFLYKVEKRMVKKVVAKALKNMPPVRIDLAQYNKDYQEFYGSQFIG